MIGTRPIELEVDGGVNRDTVKDIVEAGANVLVAGSAIFNGDDYSRNISELRGAAVLK